VVSRYLWHVLGVIVGVSVVRSPISRGSNPGISGAATTQLTSCATCSAWRLTGSTLP